MDNMVNEQIIAIIPARGGSKRIPKKNIIDFDGKPMIAWTIEAALKSKYISNVIVSTDDLEIAEVSKVFGAEVPFLRESNADDHSPISLATIHTLTQIEKQQKKKPKIVVQLMANCPLRDQNDIDLAIENFLANKNNFQISCFKYGWINPWWAHKVDETGKAEPIFDEVGFKRSQDLPDLFCPTGAIWIARVPELIESQTFYGENYKFFPLSWLKAIDIDDYADLEMASILSKRLNE
jgi:CMP-N-acetylneuraminic acid synthetase